MISRVTSNDAPTSPEIPFRVGILKFMFPALLIVAHIAPYPVAGRDLIAQSTAARPRKAVKPIGVDQKVIAKPRFGIIAILLRLEIGPDRRIEPIELLGQLAPHPRLRDRRHFLGSQRRIHITWRQLIILQCHATIEDGIMGDIDKAADLAKDIGAIEIFICRFEIMIVVAKEADLHAMLTPIGFGRQIRLDIAAKTTLRIIGLGKDIAVVKAAKLILLQKPERPSMVAGPIRWALIGSKRPALQQPPIARQPQLLPPSMQPV